jgi:hypothetical protein
VTWDLDENEARDMAEQLLASMEPPENDEWVITRVDERDWGWIVSWLNRRAAEGSTDTHDLYAGGGPFLVDRKTGRVAMAGSAHAVDHYVNLWRSGDWPDTPRP